MQYERTASEKIKICGISVRTSNILEMNSDTAEIPTTLEKFFTNNLAEKISNRKKPGTTYCVYTNYESDHNGLYTYFVGEEVTEFSDMDIIFEKLTIPKQTYAKFNIGPGIMPDICINAWRNIWNMKPQDLGGKRSYLCDFEIYDERAADRMNTKLDIYLGII